MSESRWRQSSLSRKMVLFYYSGKFNVLSHATEMKKKKKVHNDVGGLNSSIFA